MEIILRFHLDEEVTPYLFSRRVASTLSQYGALRPGEKVSVEEDGSIYIWKAIEPNAEDHVRLI